jgi:hypothetical protein
MTGRAPLRLFARAQRNEVAIALEGALDLGLIGHAVDFAPALLGYDERGRQAILKRRGVDRQARLLERLGYEDFIAYGSPW